MKKNILIFLLVFFVWSCSVTTQKGQVVGFVTHLTNDGVIWKSWDFEINSSQTGMTSTANETHLSIDNDNEDQDLVNQLDSAQKYGWKVQVDYVQNFGTNCMNNRGTNSAFVKKVEILDKTPLGVLNGDNQQTLLDTTTKKVPDTIFVVIVGRSKGK